MSSSSELPVGNNNTDVRLSGTEDDISARSFLDRFGQMSDTTFSRFVAEMPDVKAQKLAQDFLSQEILHQPGYPERLLSLCRRLFSIKESTLAEKILTQTGQYQQNFLMIIMSWKIPNKVLQEFVSSFYKKYSRIFQVALIQQDEYEQNALMIAARYQAAPELIAFVKLLAENCPKTLGASLIQQNKYGQYISAQGENALMIIVGNHTTSAIQTIVKLLATKCPAALKEALGHEITSIASNELVTVFTISRDRGVGLEISVADASTSTAKAPHVLYVLLDTLIEHISSLDFCRAELEKWYKFFGQSNETSVFETEFFKTALKEYLGSGFLGFGFFKSHCEPVAKVLSYFEKNETPILQEGMQILIQQLIRDGLFRLDDLDKDLVAILYVAKQRSLVSTSSPVPAPRALCS